MVFDVKDYLLTIDHGREDPRSNEGANLADGGSGTIKLTTDSSWACLAS